jgi:hypothetical protein
MYIGSLLLQCVTEIQPEFDKWDDYCEGDIVSVWEGSACKFAFTANFTSSCDRKSVTRRSLDPRPEGQNIVVFCLRIDEFLASKTLLLYGDPIANLTSHVAGAQVLSSDYIQSILLSYLVSDT